MNDLKNNRLASLHNMPNDYKSNGCGADKARFDFVPDTIFGLSIVEACRRHDYAYERGGNTLDKSKADNEFLDNMLIIINNYKKWYYPHWLARHRAMTYYDAVVRAGAVAFNYNEEII